MVVFFVMYYFVLLMNHELLSWRRNFQNKHEVCMMYAEITKSWKTKKRKCLKKREKEKRNEIETTRYFLFM
jgi:hypothetical protein